MPMLTVYVTLATATPTSPIGDDLAIDITITNPTTSAIEIDSWLAVGDGVTFDVRGPDGALRPMTRRDRPHREPHTLAPGAAFRTYIDLSHHVDLEAIGRYEVVARIGSVASAPLAFERTLRISQRGSHSELFYAMQDVAAARRSHQPDEALRWANRGLAELRQGYHPRHAAADTTPAELVAAAGSADRTIAVLERRIAAYQTRHFHPNLASARGDLGIARTAIASGDVKLAIVRARGGLDTLGPHYAPDDVADDTGLKIAAAADRERAGALADAAAVLCAMLESRIALYERRWRDEL